VFRASARVVTAAAPIMISVFAGFILVDDPVIKPIGFALAFGVLVDAFLIRMTLVPAVLALLQDHAWELPDRIARRLPNLDIEGERLATTAPSLVVHRTRGRHDDPSRRRATLNDG
jgi:RND superfamily putative drug exporter